MPKRVRGGGVCVALLFLAAFTTTAQDRGLVRVPAPVGPEGQIRELYTGSYALLVGVAQYQQGAAWSALESIPNELTALEGALKGQGFDAVQRVTNPTGAELERAIKEFIGKYGYNQGNRLFFFFAGHGYTLDNGERGFFVPRDAPDPLRDEAGFRRVALSMQQIATWAQEITARHALFAFDSCFSGAIFRTRDRSTPQRITASTAQPVREFISAGGAGEPVPARSVFTPVLVRALNGAADLDNDGFVTGTELGNFVQREVIEYRTGQTPQFGKIRDVRFDQGDIVFLPPQGASRAVAAAPASAPPPAAARPEATRTPTTASTSAPRGGQPMSAANWAGSYENAIGIRMTLSSGSNNAFDGELNINTPQMQRRLKVSLRTVDANHLDGTFSDAFGTYPLRAERGTDLNRIVLNSEGNVFELQRAGAAPTSGGQTRPATTNRKVVFNGARLDTATLLRLEGPAPVIPDGNYWYDKRSGMAGSVGGPAAAYLMPNLDFCPPLSPQASGGGTNVIVNGRTLHPQDLAGLQYYFGAMQPGRYWLDGQGNYGFENGPVVGNLVQQIAMLQAASARQGVAAPGGDSVYRYFPTLGPTGTGVTVANVGGGDSIVNVGGVMWWPGK